MEPEDNETKTLDRNADFFVDVLQNPNSVHQYQKLRLSLLNSPNPVPLRAACFRGQSTSHFPHYIYICHLHNFFAQNSG